MTALLIKKETRFGDRNIMLFGNVLVGWYSVLWFDNLTKETKMKNKTSLCKAKPVCLPTGVSKTFGKSHDVVTNTKREQMNKTKEKRHETETTK